MGAISAPQEPLLYAFVALAAVNLFALGLAWLGRRLAGGAGRPTPGRGQRGSVDRQTETPRHEPDGERSAGAADDRPTGTGDPDAVRCPSCGTENEAGYRYCRNCIGELPGATGFTTTPGSGGWTDPL